jgi:hypothetical protein
MVSFLETEAYTSFSPGIVNAKQITQTNTNNNLNDLDIRIRFLEMKYTKISKNQPINF